jgi:alpha-N-arabinofuranosidase
MAKKATITVHPLFEIGEISPRLYGAFLEPIGTLVNGGMYNPKHPTADKKGFRGDFLDAIKASKLPALRLPGGNFISGWDWKDSIGPVGQRKSHLDLAWRQYYTNEVGHDEYLQWAEYAGTEAMYTINLGTGNINDAISIIEYTNHPRGTYWSDLRGQYGHEKPYGVKTWYLGNEMDGPWQIASWEKNPRGYGILANETSKAMKWVDPRIETVACASSSPFLAHYPQWDLDMLEECYESVDYISLHHYHSAAEGDYGALLGGVCFFEDYINTEIALCDFMQTKLRSPKKMMLSFDEYGSHIRPLAQLHPGRDPHNLYAVHYSFDPSRNYIRHDPDSMDFSRRFAQDGTIVSALAGASVMLAFLRHADRVKIGCMTRGLQVLAAANHDHVWKSCGYYPFTQLMRYGRGVSLRTVTQCDTFDIPGYAIDDNSQYSTHEGVGFIDTAAAFDKESGELTVFVINRNWEDSNDVEIQVPGFDGYRFVEHIQLSSDQLDTKNTDDNPDALVPSINSGAVYGEGKVSANVKRLSWNVFRFQKTGAK